MKRPEFVPKGWKKTTAEKVEIGVECWALVNPFNRFHLGEIEPVPERPALRIFKHKGYKFLLSNNRKCRYLINNENTVYYNPKTTAAAKERARFSVRCKVKNCPLGADVLFLTGYKELADVYGKLQYMKEYYGYVIESAKHPNETHFACIGPNVFIYYDPNSVPTLKQNDESIEGF